MGIELVRESETARGQGRAIGEAGCEHLRAALDGLVLESREAGVELLRELTYMTGLGSPDTGDLGRPSLSLHPARGRKRGDYCRGMRAIRLFGEPRVATLAHEFAHHFVAMRYMRVRQTHGKEFKAAFERAVRALCRILGRPMPGPGTSVRSVARSEMPKVGSKVAFQARLPGSRRVQRLVGTVERRLQTRVQVVVPKPPDRAGAVQGEVRYRVPVHQIKSSSGATGCPHGAE